MPGGTRQQLGKEKESERGGCREQRRDRLLKSEKFFITSNYTATQNGYASVGGVGAFNSSYTVSSSSRRRTEEG